jgi:hypothetical protein
MDELFEIQEVLSPRAAWLKRHDVQTLFSAGCDDPWSAWSGPLAAAVENETFATGLTAEDAVVQWAIKHGVRLWNEERIA